MKKSPTKKKVQVTISKFFASASTTKPTFEHTDNEDTFEIMSSQSALYRQRLKREDPEAHERYLQKQRDAAKARRQRRALEPMTRAKEIEMAAKRERHRINQAKYRANQNGDRRPRPRTERQANPVAGVKFMTPDERRAHYARLRTESRARQSAQKKRRVRERARDYMRQKRAMEGRPLAQIPSTPPPGPSTPLPPPPGPSTPLPPLPGPSTPLPGPSTPLPGPSTPSAGPSTPPPGPSTPPPGLSTSLKPRKWKTLLNCKSRLKKLLRKNTPKDCATILEGLVQAKTPEFKAAIKERGFLRSPRRKVCRNIFSATRPKKDQKKAEGMKRVANFLVSRARTTRSKKWSQQIKEFYLRYDVSRTLPHARYSTKHGPAHVMTVTIRAAWQQFLMDHEGISVGYTKFASLRPRNVRKLGSVPAESCLCMYCQNVKYKIDAINRLLALRGIDLLPSVSKMLDLICCPVLKPECIFGECASCFESIRLVAERCQPILGLDVSWLGWKRREEDKKLDISPNSGSVRDLLKSFTKDIDLMTSGATFRHHLFTAHWQYKQAKLLKCTLEEGEAMFIMDFAENRKASFADEVKSVHFSKRQITLHPVVAYWRNQQCQLVRHVLMYLSDDIRHDYHAVNHFTMLAIKHVKRQTYLRRVIIFSDGCSSQYKGKGTFADLSLIQGLEVERAFYGSEHGKGEADGETGVLSQELKRAVLGGKVNIRHAHDLFLWADSALKQESVTSSRLFFLVKEGDIIRNRPHTEVATLKGSRRFHQFRRVTDYKLECRRLACYCSACKCKRSELCIHSDWVGPWETRILRGAQDGRSELDTAFMQEEHETELPDLNEAFIETTPSTSFPTPPVGSFIEVVHTTERGAHQTFKCMVSEGKASKKRNQCNQDADKECEPREKKACLSDEPTYSAEDFNSNGTTSVGSSGPSIIQRGHKNKVKEFEYDSSTDLEGTSRREFISQDCFMVDFSQSSDETENENSKADEETENISQSPSGSKQETTSSSGSVSKSLSQFKIEKSKKAKASTKYTPLEQQFMEIKAENPKTLLFVECGYKYRFFGEDAEIAAKILNIFCHLDHNFMTASIPVHRLFVHVRRLVAAGYKVGVVKQMETAHLKAAGDNKSAPFSRKLTALYTKSTLIGEDVDPVSNGEDNKGESISGLKANNYLLCLYEGSESKANKKREIGLVCVDPATGDIIYDNFSDGDTYSELETRIAHLQPVELLIPENVSSDMEKIVSDIASLSMKDDDRIRVEKLKSKDVPSASEATLKLTDFYDKKSLQTVLNLPKPVQVCLSTAISYLKAFNLDGILSMTSNFQNFMSRSKHMHLSGQCLANLEVFHNSCDGSERGSLFNVLNHTHTRFGTRLLKKWIAQPLLDEDEICQRLEAVEEINSGNMPDLKKTRELLSKLPDVERGLCSIFYKKSSPIEFYNVTYALEKIRKQFLDYRKYANCQMSSTLLLSLINEIPDLLEDVGAYCNSISESAARKSDKANLFIDESQFPPIMERKKEIASVITDLNEHRREVRKLLHQPGLDYVSVNQIEFLIQVKNTALKTVPSSWTSISSTKQVTRFHSPFIVKNYRKLNELREQLVGDVVLAWQGFLGDFSENYVKYRKAVKCIASFDCLLSLAKTALQDSFCKPDVSSENTEVHIEQGRHPILDSLKAEGEQFMPNDTHLTADGLRVMVISGPNMGGKSSYIRQVALLSIMAQIGSYVPAESARLGILDGIFTRMGATDKIFQGQSTFMVELQEASEIISQATPRSLIILDELGRGTSTHDGVAIAHATLKHFITQTKSLVLFVTHFPMMLEFHNTYPGIVDNFHMSFFLTDSDDPEDTDVITFLYQLTEGAAEKSYGLNVARLAEISSSIRQKASKKSQELEGKIAKRIANRETFKRYWTTEEKDILQLIQDPDKS